MNSFADVLRHAGLVQLGVLEALQLGDHLMSDMLDLVFKHLLHKLFRVLEHQLCLAPVPLRDVNSEKDRDGFHHAFCSFAWVRIALQFAKGSVFDVHDSDRQLFIDPVLVLSHRTD